MISNSEPIYQSFVKYLEKDSEFQDILILKSFGPLEKEIEKSQVFQAIQKTFDHAGLKKLEDSKLDKILLDCDIDKNMKYNKIEIKILFQKVMGMVLLKMRNEGVFEDMLNEIFKSLDLDNSGSIEIEEIEPFLGKYLSVKNIMEPNKEALHKAFNELDKDKNKKLDRGELAILVSRVTELQFEQSKAHMKK